MNLQTEYLGLKLKNPIIIGSSGLTNTVEKNIKLAENNAGALVLKSIFEEQINFEMEYAVDDSSSAYQEAIDYARSYTKDKYINEYLKLIADTKKAVSIPVIASINCVSKGSWTDFAKQIQDAGADAIEINISLLPSDFKKNSKDNEQIYFDVIKQIRKKVSIPLAIKMSPYSAGLAQLIQKLSWTEKVNGFVLFNRYYNPDIDINKLELKPAEVLSTSSEQYRTLRWIALLSGEIKSSFAASTGVHTGEDAIKQVLAGANAVQIVSTVYKNGGEVINTILAEIEKWMEDKGYSSINEFKGKFAYSKMNNSRAFERIQHMKHFGGLE